jgi:phosphoribosylanthranilate isomerase
MRTRIKICGLTREADVDAAVEAGADAIGFVLYSNSPRAVSVARAAELARRLPPFVTAVGLFVNAAPSLVTQAVTLMPTLMLQFHGDESDADCDRWQRPYVRAARVATGFNLLDFSARYPSAQAILLDAPVVGYGGGGKVFDWSLVQRAAHLRLVLSGGLHAGNVIQGIGLLRPWAVDVSSGVETDKGIKDAVAIRNFCEAVRAADRHSPVSSA